MVVILGRALHSYLGSVVLGWRECWRINSVCALEEEIEFLDGIVTSGGQGQLFFCSSDDLLQQPTFAHHDFFVNFIDSEYGIWKHVVLLYCPEYVTL